MAFSHLAPTVPAAAGVSAAIKASIFARLDVLKATAVSKARVYSSNLASLHVTVAAK